MYLFIEAFTAFLDMFKHNRLATFFSEWTSVHFNRSN